MSAFTLLLGTGFLLITLGGAWRIELFAPGPLTHSHAQLLGGKLKNDRCAACHDIAGTSWGEWFGSGGKSHTGLTQNDLCNDCHHQRIPKQRSGLAHNLSQEELYALKNLNQQLQDLPSGMATNNVKQSSQPQTLSGENLACSSCHREHGGPFHDLTLMSSAACQSCHQTKYASFVEDHPDWNSWPSNTKGFISFDHKSHLAHFAKKETAFLCQSCHSPTANVTYAVTTQLTRTNLSRTPSFETGCASCHASPLESQSNEGFVLLQLPVLDNIALESSDSHLQFEWPESVQGAEPFSIPPMMEWLLSNRAASTDALRTLKSPYYKPWVQEPTKQQNQAVVKVASEIQSLLKELAMGYQEAANTPPASNQFNSLFDHLPRQRLRSAIRQWLNSQRRIQDTSEVQDLTSEVQDSDQEDLLEPLDAVSLAPGWYRDDQNFKIGYRGTGHADAVLKTLCELVFNKQTDEALRSSLLSIPSVKSCLECHRDGIQSPTLDAHPTFQWVDQPSFATAQSLTKFSHTPHLNIQSLADCKYCHTIPSENGKPVSSVSSFALQDPHNQPHSDFGIAGKQTCVACHRPEAAGDSCTQCHRYHAMFSATEFLSDPQASAPQLEEARHESPIQEISSQQIQR